MYKAILYKEWIKSRYYLLIAAVVTVATTVFVLLSLNKSLTFNSIWFMWISILEQDIIPVRGLKFLPAVLGIGLALVQFIPEMQEKRLKLTLHLPVNAQLIIIEMLVAGLLPLFLLYGLQLGSLALYFDHYLAPELVHKIFATAGVWYVAGLMAYLLTAWIVLEPTWKMRIFNAAVAAGLLQLMYFWDSTCGYGPMVPLIIIWCVALLFFPLYSTWRFRRGCQD